MPSSTVLPEDLKSLAFRNALRVDSGADFRHHMDRLCNGLRATPRSSPPTAHSPQPIPATSALRIGPDVRVLLALAAFILTLIVFGFLGFLAASLIAGATNETIGCIGAVLTWGFGMWLSYFLWQRIQ